MHNYYIFTEIVGCGKIGKIAIDSFHKYHNLPIHIYGTKKDFEHISENKNNIFIEVDKNIIRKFTLGHWGTAHIWEKAIITSKSNKIIHFDSDVIFRQSIVDEIIKQSEKGFDLIGSRRNYYSNKNGRNDVRFIIDLCQTSLILFNKEKISNKLFKKTSIRDFFKSLYTLNLKRLLKNIALTINQAKTGNLSATRFCKMIHGTYSPFDFPHIDFFDPVMLEMINNGAKINYINPEYTGTEDFYGKSYSLINEIDIGTKLAHFSGVGSGLNFINNPNVQSVSREYKEHCIKKYKTFCKTFYNEFKNDAETHTRQDSLLNNIKWY